MCSNIGQPSGIKQQQQKKKCSIGSLCHFRDYKLHVFEMKKKNLQIKHTSIIYEERKNIQ